MPIIVVIEILFLVVLVVCTTKEDKGANNFVAIINVDGANYDTKAHLSGDVSYPLSFDFPITYLRVEGMDFSVCQAGPRKLDGTWSFPASRIVVPAGSNTSKYRFFPSAVSFKSRPRSPTVKQILADGTTIYEYSPSLVRSNLYASIRNISQLAGVILVGSDCGFNLQLHSYMREVLLSLKVATPIALSSLSVLPVINAVLGPKARVAIVTANSTNFNLHLDTLVPEWMNVAHDRLEVIGCEVVPDFFPEVAGGLTVNPAKAAPELLELVQGVLDRFEGTLEQINAVILECAELPPYTADFRTKLHPPGKLVWDAISVLDFVRDAMVTPDYGWDNNGTLAAESKARLII